MATSDIEHARASVQAARYAEAIEYCERVLGADPSQVDALTLLGIAQSSIGRVHDGVAALRRAVELHPQNGVLWMNLGTALSQAGGPAEAVSCLQEGVRRCGESAALLYTLAVAEQTAGHVSSAIRSYRRCIELDPNLPAAHNNLATLLERSGRPAEAIACLREALRLKPDYVRALTNLGAVLMRLGDPGQALEPLARALGLEPRHAPAHLALGNALAAAGRRDEALGRMRTAVDLAPDFLEARLGLGHLSLLLGRPEEALGAFEAALRLRAADPGALKGRGIALAQSRRHEQAIASFEAALAHSPGDTELHYNLAISLQADGRAADALRAYDRALQLRPDLAEAWNNRGNALRALSRPAEAVASYQEAVRLRPAFADALYNLGNMLMLSSRPAEALAAYDEALALDPNYPYVAGNALAAAMLLSDWARYSQRVERATRCVDSGGPVAGPLTLNQALDDPERMLRGAQLWVADRFPQAREPLCSGARSHERIRVAYMSGDFREHPVAASLAGVIERHDRNLFEVLGISLAPDPLEGALRARLQKAFDRFVDVSQLADRDAAQLIRTLEVDLLVDLMGHTEGSRTGILAFRPAPVQVAFLGYPGTLGARYVDYIVADRVVLPPSQQQFYAEKAAYLPVTCLPNEHAQLAQCEAPTREAVGLPEQAFVFCSFNNNSKITPVMFDVWLQLLAEVKGSVLWLTVRNPTAAAHLVRRAAAKGIQADRLVFAERVPRVEDHLARLRLADLFLDTFPYNAHTTAADALWADVPVVTRQGQTFASRVAASLLAAVGVPELVTATLEDYLALARHLAEDSSALSRVKEKIARNRLCGPLFDTRAFTLGLEGAYRAIWERYRSGLPPEHLDAGA